MRGVIAVGFDLDGTLYKSTPEIDGRVQNKIAEAILQKKPELGNVQEARHYFEKRYAIVESGRQIIEEAGYTDSERIMDRCLAEAEIVDLLQPDPRLASMLERLRERRLYLFLLTASPEKNALDKLKKIGVDREMFDLRVYSDTENAGRKSSGDAFRYVLQLTGISPSKMAYVGDRKRADILPPRELGMAAIAVGSHIEEASFSIPEIYDLEGLLI